MEGNFYISDVVVDRTVRSKYGAAYEHCKDEALRYGRCVEGGHINRDLRCSMCAAERDELSRCVRKHLSAK